MHNNQPFLTDYGKICTTCGSIAIAVSGAYFLVAVLLRSFLHGETLALFETVPTYVPAISFLVCGLSTVACAWKPYRNFILLNITSLLSIFNAGLSSVITIAVIFVNFKSFNAMNQEGCRNATIPNTCHCDIIAYSPAFPTDKTAIFETSGCQVGIWILNGCLVLLTLTSLIAIFLSVFLCRLLDELGD